MAKEDCATAILARLNDGELITLSDSLCVNCQAVWNAVWHESDGTITMGELRAKHPCMQSTSFDPSWTAAQ